MRSFLYTLLALPLLGGAVAEQSSTQTLDASTSIYANAHEAFQDLLNVLPEESLQAALNSLTKFKAGVFESHRRGVEHVHDSSPALATKLIVAAVQDLKKRQVAAPSNGTTPIEPSQTPSQTPDQPQSSAPASTPQPSSQQPENTQQSSPAADTPAVTAASTPSSRPVLIPVEVTTTDTAGSTVVQTSEVFSEVTASVSVTVTRTTTNERGSTIAVTTQEVRPAVIRTTTDERGSSIAVTSAANYAPTRGEVLTTTNERGSTMLTTYTPAGGRVSSVRLLTTTDAEGRPSTSTIITYVDPTDVAGGGGGDGDAASADPTRTGGPSVQSGAANKANAALVGMAGLGAFAVFF